MKSKLIAYFVLGTTTITAGVFSNLLSPHVFLWNMKIDLYWTLFAIIGVLIISFLFWLCGQEVKGAWDILFSKQVKNIEALLHNEKRAAIRDITIKFLNRLNVAKENKVPVMPNDCRRWEIQVGIPFKVELKFPEITLGFGPKVDGVCQQIRRQAWGPGLARDTVAMNKAFEEQKLPTLEEIENAFRP